LADTAQTVLICEHIVYPEAQRSLIGHPEREVFEQTEAAVTLDWDWRLFAVQLRG
jgi:hypothetical protein